MESLCLFRQNKAADPNINTGMEWALELFIDNPLVHRPNTGFDYSTFGYNLAGVVFEKGTGRSLAEIVDTEISQKMSIMTLSPDYFWSHSQIEWSVMIMLMVISVNQEIMM